MHHERGQSSHIGTPESEGMILGWGALSPHNCDSESVTPSWISERPGADGSEVPHSGLSHIIYRITSSQHPSATPFGGHTSHCTLAPSCFLLPCLPLASPGPSQEVARQNVPTLFPAHRVCDKGCLYFTM